MSIKDRLWRIRYKQYLKSDKWKLKRYLVLKRDNFKCTKCGKKTNLQVHHKTYTRVFNEHLSDLITLCKKCHKEEHNKKH